MNSKNKKIGKNIMQVSSSKTTFGPKSDYKLKVPIRKSHKFSKNSASQYLSKRSSVKVKQHSTLVLSPKNMKTNQLEKYNRYSIQQNQVTKGQLNFIKLFKFTQIALFLTFLQKYSVKIINR